MNTKPRSGYDTVGGMNYFPRMLDKIRLHAKGELHPDYHANLGIRISGDGLCCAFLRLPYEQVRERALTGGTDEEILHWCVERGGRKLEPMDLHLWNELSRKLGWNDRVSANLARLKDASGLSHRDDIQTMFEYFDVDEGRKS